MSRRLADYLGADLDRLLPYQNACAGAIGRFEDHIAQTLGDGLMVYFG